ncbi:MAG: hypothetical protein GX138_08730 [Firmicutes bacterium]|jgi:putative zinc finger/helix-turn-helix YgiT family protein|nr:hypothetical protein [Bacillota bacterium]
MEIIKKAKKECLLCMEEHEVETAKIQEVELFRNREVTYTATYEYCSNTDELIETEEMFKSNDLALKDSYRAEVGLLTSNEIKAIREKYRVSQKGLTRVLGWDEATISCYETFQIQDRIHDNLL